MQLRHERMNAGFEKWHVEGLPIGCSFHSFTLPDDGDPHDHPWAFSSHILSGSYVEDVYALDGTVVRFRRCAGTVHQVPATRIHRIVQLPQGPCLTLVRAGPWEREPRFWRFDGEARSRQWNEDW